MARIKWRRYRGSYGSSLTTVVGFDSFLRTNHLNSANCHGHVHLVILIVFEIVLDSFADLGNFNKLGSSLVLNVRILCNFTKLSR